MGRKVTKYPSNYVKATTNSEVSDNEIIDVYVCDGADGGSVPDTLYVEAQTQYDVITIYAKNNWLDRYEPKYIY